MRNDKHMMYKRKYGLVFSPDFSGLELSLIFHHGIPMSDFESDAETSLEIGLKLLQVKINSYIEQEIKHLRESKQGDCNA